jgi:hypothetical protein
MIIRKNYHNSIVGYFVVITRTHVANTYVSIFYMNNKIPKGKGVIINLNRIPCEEWTRIFEATKDRTPIFKINPLTQDESRGFRTLSLLAPTFGRTRMCQTAPPLRGLKSSALQAAIHQRTKVRRFLAVAINTTIRRTSVRIIEEIRKHGEVMIDTRLDEYLPAIDECIEMYKPFEPWAITFRSGNEYVMLQAQHYKVITIAIASVRIIGTDDECLHRNRATC